MKTSMQNNLIFWGKKIEAEFVHPDGKIVKRKIEIRKNPITGRTSRIAFSRIHEKETGISRLPPPPPDAENTENCPFCAPQVYDKTPRLRAEISKKGRLKKGESLLFPNLFPYGAYSAVSLFDNKHFVEIGKASLESYRDCFINCADYLGRIKALDPENYYMAITQNHLPSAGGSLIHPHLQINADKIPPNNHRFLEKKSRDFFNETGKYFLWSYLAREKKEKTRYIGNTGPWEWISAFAPEGFFEIWGIYPGCTDFEKLKKEDWEELAKGVLNTQLFYRSLNRNGYNLGMLIIAKKDSFLELRIVILVRSNYAPWVRNDHTGFEVMLGDMTTFTAPEEVARLARPFWKT